MNKKIYSFERLSYNVLILQNIAADYNNAQN